MFLAILKSNCNVRVGCCDDSCSNSDSCSSLEGSYGWKDSDGSSFSKFSDVKDEKKIIYRGGNGHKKLIVKKTTLDYILWIL